MAKAQGLSDQAPTICVARGLKPAGPVPPRPARGSGSKSGKISGPRTHTFFMKCRSR